MKHSCQAPKNIKRKEDFERFWHFRGVKQNIYFPKLSVQCFLRTLVSWTETGADSYCPLRQVRLIPVPTTSNRHKLMVGRSYRSWKDRFIIPDVWACRSRFQLCKFLRRNTWLFYGSWRNNGFLMCLLDFECSFLFRPFNDWVKFTVKQFGFCKIWSEVMVIDFLEGDWEVLQLKYHYFEREREARNHFKIKTKNKLLFLSICFVVYQNEISRVNCSSPYILSLQYI